MSTPADAYEIALPSARSVIGPQSTGPMNTPVSAHPGEYPASRPPGAPRKAHQRGDVGHTAASATWSVLPTSSSGLVPPLQAGDPSPASSARLAVIAYLLGARPSPRIVGTAIRRVRRS